MTLSFNKIEIDLTLLVQDFYPALTTKQTESIAYRIAKDFDYSELYDAGLNTSPVFLSTNA